MGTEIILMLYFFETHISIVIQNEIVYYSAENITIDS